MEISVAIVDDHELMAKALSGLIQKFEGYNVIYEVSSGEEFIHRVKLDIVPEIVLLDINMPDMDGYQLAEWITGNCSRIKILALSMNNSEDSIVKMLRNGAVGYLLKGCKPVELKQALDAVTQNGYYYTEFITRQLIKNLNPSRFKSPSEQLGLNEREVKFVQLSCSDMTYVEISERMCVSPRTIDGYRESVFQKMNVKSRVGMVIEAIRLEIFVP
jgi:two-component system invasion response regulator UvrY